MAPQVLQGVYTSQADLWAIGVVSYMVLSATKPFYSQKRKKMIDLIMRGKAYFDGAAWANISTEGKDFVQKLLVVDPKERMTATDALHHPWIVDRHMWHDDKPSENMLMKLDTSLLNYRQTSQLKKLALTVIAHRSTAQEAQPSPAKRETAEPLPRPTARQCAGRAAAQRRGRRSRGPVLWPAWPPSPARTDDHHY